jgi:electron transfer flavoprotein beta subunit
MSVPNDKLEVSRMGDMGELKTAIHIVVLAKRIPDPEPSAVPFRVDPDTWRRIEVPGLQMVVSPYDEQCIEVALRLREQLGGARITVLSLGRGRGEDIKLFKRVFSWEVDAGVFLCDPAFDGGDATTTARVLAAGVRKLEDVDLVLAGRQAADFDEGVVGLTVAELLEWPVLPVAGSVQIDGGSVTVDRLLEAGIATLQADLPAVVTVSNEVGPPRQPSMRQMMRAGRMKPEVWTASDLGLDEDQVGSQAARLRIEEVFVPQIARDCEFVAGDTPEEQAADLLRRLDDRRVLA